jgi:hypothetical protein
MRSRGLGGLCIALVIACAGPSTAAGEPRKASGWCGTVAPEPNLVLTVDQERLLGGRGKRSVGEAAGRMRALTADFLYCYQEARERAPGLEGEMQLVLTVERTGKLSDARVVRDTTADASFRACVARAALRRHYIGNRMGGRNRYSMRLIFEHEPDRGKRRPGARDRDWILHGAAS